MNTKTKKIHYAGGIVYSNGNRLPGWACCCSGDQALKIKKEGKQAYYINEVTCKNCLKMIERQENFRLKHPDIWEDQKHRNYCIEPVKSNAHIKFKKIS